MNNPNTISVGEQENPEMNEWQNLGESQKQQELNPEQLLKTPKMIEKLGEMGADNRIIENSAFARILEGDMGELRRAKEIAINNKGDKGMKAEYFGDISGSKTNNRGEIAFDIKDDGSLAISSASAERSKYGLNDDDFAYEMHAKGDFTETTFRITDEGLLSINIYNNADEELFRQGKSGHPNEGYRSVYGETQTRVFDNEGVEIFREIKSYKPSTTSFNSSNFLLYDKTTGFGQETPERLPYKMAASKEIKSLMSLVRNNDGVTAKVHYYNMNAYTGQSETVDLEKCRINDEYGNNELVPENGAISAALAEKKQ